jgi:hypothetical protein
MKSLIDRPLHPFLFAAYPVLALLAWNLGELQPIAGLRALVLSLLLAGGLAWVLSRLLHDSAKGAILTSLGAVLFFSYGHVYQVTEGVSLAGLVVGRHRVLLVIWAAVLIGVSVWATKVRAIPAGLTRFLNITMALALVLPLLQIGSYQVRELSKGFQTTTAPASPVALAPPAGQPLPDVYYIILDAYTRQDVLERVFSYDNRPFIQGLRDLGFVVTDHSRSNYAITRLSIPSSLNMNYLDKLGPPLDPNAKDAAWLDRICKGNAVREALSSLGYKTVAFESAYGMTDWQNADIYLSPRPASLADARAFGGLNPFEAMLVQTSLGRAVIDGRVKLNELLGAHIPDPNKEFRDRILFAFDRLGRVPEIPGPKFVWVHIMSPHPPYIFTADGGIASQQGVFTLADQVSGSGSPDERTAYAGQVNYINTRVLQAVKQILANSKTPPIIVIQGDHGAFHVTPEDRMKNLNAYYFPNGGSPQVYDSISPVNTFRVIFNRYFGADLPLLPDRHYYSNIQKPFDLTPIP